ncbi:MAG: BirA [Anaerocolumna sp.]|jgi:BirA family biotin operon repressor/biotin-[acetyl-CoA-carboxylase] ligase|nr:BirA [Anaerocolumna sp.]
MDYNSNIDHVIDSKALENYITTKILGKNIMYYEEIDSTNTVAKRIGKETSTHGVLVLANKQNAGRGRLGREWDSPKNEGIWMSLILKPVINITKASMLTLIAALAVNKGIRVVTGLESYIKWPNDIIINGKKVCGILTEMSTSKDILECIVVGIGINVSNTCFEPDIKNKATSLKSEGCLQIDKLQLINEIMLAMEYYYEIFLRNQSLVDLSAEYNKWLINRNNTVKIIEREESYTGVALGINDLGELLVKTQVSVNGETIEIIKEVVSGEVSVRGVYGYV